MRKFPGQVPNKSLDMGATPLHLVRTVVAQRCRNAGRQEGQKEEQNAIVSGWIGWIHSPEKRGKESEEDKERERDGRVPLSHFTSNVSLLRPRKSCLSKRLLIRPRVAGEGAREQTLEGKNHFRGSLMAI